MGVIAAQLGHVDTRMAEKHYAHLALSYIADTIRAKLPARSRPRSRLARSQSMTNTTHTLSLAVGWALG